MLEKIEVTLVGVSPLIMHNRRLADPLDPAAIAVKKIASIRKKTEEQLRDLRHVEWLGGLYLDADDQIAVPSDNVLALVIEGARKTKRGKDAQAGVFEAQPFYRLFYTGPNEPEALYKAGGFVDYRSVVISRKRIMRSRPRFAEWTLPIQLLVNSEVFEVEYVREALEVAGERIGLGDYRPRFGRFTVE